MANLGFSSVTFPAPVFLGDTLYAETEVAATRESASRPGQGVVTLTHRGVNQRGELVCSATRAALVLGEVAWKGGPGGVPLVPWPPPLVPWPLKAKSN